MHGNFDSMLDIVIKIVEVLNNVIFFQRGVNLSSGTQQKVESTQFSSDSADSAWFAVFIRFILLLVFFYSSTFSGFNSHPGAS